MLIKQLIVLVLLSVLIAEDAKSQTVDTLVTVLEELAQFEEAKALDVDPAGIVYVVDIGSHQLVQLQPSGEVNNFGGPGGGEGQFDSPSDIDVTNGLVLVVADAGNGRIQRFSREFLFLESLVVGDLDPENDSWGGEPAYRQREEAVDNFATGRPISLITSVDNAMYAIDEIGNVVVKWDNNRNIAQTIGGFDQGDGILIEPVAVTLGKDGALFVADRGNEAIMLYDAFGGFDRTLAEGLCADVVSVIAHGDLLFILLKDKLLIYQDRGLLEKVVAFEIDEGLVDMAFYEDVFYLLTDGRLLRGTGLTSLATP